MRKRITTIAIAAVLGGCAPREQTESEKAAANLAETKVEFEKNVKGGEDRRAELLRPQSVDQAKVDAMIAEPK